MSYWDRKEDLIKKAQLADDPNLPRNKRAGSRNSDDKPRETPLRHEMVAGAVFGVTRLPKSGVWPDKHLRYQYMFNRKTRESIWENAAGNETYWWGNPSHLFRVRVVCSPNRATDVTLVERILDGRLFVVDIDYLRFIMVESDHVYV